MNAEYHNRLIRFLKAAPRPAQCEFSFKPVFGAVAAYADSRIFASCGKFGIALKLPDETCRALFESGAAQPLKYFEKGHVKKNYAVLGHDVLADQVRTARLVERSIRYVLPSLEQG